LTASDLIEGVYIFRLTVRDTITLFSTDEAEVVVNPDPGGSVDEEWGETTEHTTSTAEGTRRAMPIIVDANATITKLSLLISAAATFDIELAIYTDADGVPGNLIEAQGTTQVVGAYSKGWYEYELLVPIQVSVGEKLWLTWIHDGTVLTYYASGQPVDESMVLASTNPAEMVNPFGAVSTGTTKYSSKLLGTSHETKNFVGVQNLLI
jgi:hypothetical protein